MEKVVHDLPPCLPLVLSIAYMAGISLGLLLLLLHQSVVFCTIMCINAKMPLLQLHGATTCFRCVQERTKLVFVEVSCIICAAAGLFKPSYLAFQNTPELTSLQYL